MEAENPEITLNDTEAKALVDTPASRERGSKTWRDVEAGTVFKTLADLLSKAQVGQLATDCRI